MPANPNVEEARNHTPHAQPVPEADAITTRTAEGRRIQEEVRALVPLLRRDALASERLSSLTDEVLIELNQAGAFRLQLPKELGGYGLGVRDTVEVIAEIARGDGSAAWIAVVSGGATSALALPQQAVDEVFGVSKTWVGPIAFGGSTIDSAPGSARKVAGGWMVSGTWPFSSGCQHAAWGFVFAGYLDDQGSPRQGLFLLSHDQVEIVDDWQVMGLSATSSNSVTVDGEAFVPDHRFVDMADLFANLERARSHYDGIAFSYLPLGVVVPLSFGSLALGMARGAMESFIELAKTRKPFNLPYARVMDMASAQVTAGRARAMINAAAAIIRQHADEADVRGLTHGAYAPDESSELTMDVVYAISMCAEVINMLQVTIGSSTASLKNPIQRFVRDVRVLSTHGALRFDPMAEINGRDIFGLAPFVPFADLLTPDAQPPGPPPSPTNAPDPH